MKIHLGKQEESNKLPCEVINVSPGYRFVQNREQISVTLGDEMSDRKKHSESENMGKVRISRTAIITDLEEQISELTAIIEQMNRDHCSAQTLLSNDMDLRCAEMQKNFESKRRYFEETPAAQFSELEKNYKAALKAEKLAAQDKLGTVGTWENDPDEGVEADPADPGQRNSYGHGWTLARLSRFPSPAQEEQELLKQHERDTLQLEELRKTKEVIEEELHAQALILESLNTTLYQTQMELQREVTMVANLEKTLQTKLAEAEENFKYTIQHLTEENIHLRYE
ncbi:flagellum-associated coiled-coil domain-containing protein 1 [Physeter macrocephalus]|uniref:Flagellum-associated coiled-coil domain-containing protein 1 n=1 Tax=Physeter macrocephalus TaxID=9755 RepID=A0A455BYG9_PHYMC|nr:flagellum-associated coiled-coil domain-containing protein 1 [Physeter catodon]|eukprot:XP_028352828.1 amyotrophic lateral sclerosis 2 chromosomal region candidate gene 12 protein [Physeter catodon]